MTDFKSDYLDLRLGDCMEGMKDFPDNHFDLAIVDPPYGIGNWVQQTGNVRGEKVDWNENIPDPEYFLAVKRVSCHQIIWGANYYNSFSELGGAIIWDKRNPNPKFSKAEIASYSRLKRVDHVTIPYYGIVGEDKCFHPCAKPIQLYKWLLKNYSEPGQKILDTHLGSMSIAIACHDYKCHLTGFEIDEDYFREGTKRVQNHVNQLQLFR